MRTCCALKRRGASHRQSLRSAPFRGALHDTQKRARMLPRVGNGNELKDIDWNRGQSRLLWEQAKAAVRAAFER
jgi:hypothetical protein